MRQPLSFVISAPSGAGKTTLATRLLDGVDALTRVVTWTTRRPRAGERDGVDYTFVTEEQFERCSRDDGFLESAFVYGRRYGTPRSEIARIHGLGHDALMVLDVQGADAVRARQPQAVTIFVLPPSAAALEARLRERDGGDEAVGRRLRAAADETGRFLSYDYVIVNDDLQEAVADLVAIVRAERARSQRRAALGEQVLASFRSEAPADRP